MPSLIRVGELALHVEQPASPTTRAPILLLHGIFAAAWVFEYAQRWFSARGYASYALDLRGRGASAPVADVGRVPAGLYVEDAIGVARAVTKRHAGAAPILIGHSMGGLLAQKVAEARPNPIDPYADETYRNYARQIRQIGAVPVFVVTPVIFQSPVTFQKSPPPGLLLAFNNCKTYPMLFDPKVRVDDGHLTKEGAEKFSRLLAQEFVRRLHQP